MLIFNKNSSFHAADTLYDKRHHCSKTMACMLSCCAACINSNHEHFYYRSTVIVLSPAIETHNAFITQMALSFLTPNYGTFSAAVFQIFHIQPLFTPRKTDYSTSIFFL